MDEIVNIGETAPNAADPQSVELGIWIGRREAFGLIAGRCSAAEAESLRRIRDGRLYQKLNPTWEEFCTKQLHVSCRTVERELANLRRFGPAFFTVRQLTHISASQYAQLAQRISEDGVRLDDEVVALIPENSEQLSNALKTLLERTESAAPALAPPAFDGVLQSFRAATRKLRSFDGDLDRTQLGALAREIAAVLSAAGDRGLTLDLP